MKQNRNLAWWLATWFGSGKSPKAPGTAGSLAALPFAWVIHATYGAPALLLAAIILFPIGIVASNHYMKDNGCEHDPGEIVIDEVVGVWLLCALMPLTLTGYFVGFMTFRVFDIIKPWPISYFDRKVHGGFGVMLDDVLAAIYPVLLVLVIVVVGIAMENSVILEWLRPLIEIQAPATSIELNPAPIPPNELPDVNP